MSKHAVQQEFAKRRLHFIGIGGAGMSGLAQVAMELGARVTGSDASESVYTELLRKRGIDPLIGHSADQLPADAEAVVSTAISTDNPELKIAHDRDQRVLHRGELLAQIAALKSCIAVVGTHGKTTTASMVAHCLIELGLDPAFVIGGQLRGSGSNAQWGAGKWIVVEADESDGSFLRLRPTVAALTNLELDHHARYSSLVELEECCRQFLAAVPGDGTAVTWNRPELTTLLPTDRSTLRYDAQLHNLPGQQPQPGAAESAEPPYLYAAEVSFTRLGSRFQLLRDGKLLTEVTIAVPGTHNVLNALAALAILEAADIDLVTGAAALASFNGSERRFEPKGSYNGAEIFDDYAHHPTEVRVTLETARRLNPKRLVVVFQPHLYSRTLYLARDFGRALALADEVVVLDVYPARERPIGELAGVSGKLVVDAVADQAPGRAVWWLPTQGEAVAYLRSELREGDVVMTVGAGDVDLVGQELVRST